MYEPIIDPMIFYLIELVEKLQLACLLYTSDAADD